MAVRRGNGKPADLAMVSIEILKDIRTDLRGVLTEQTKTNIRLDELNSRVGRLEERFDKFLLNAGEDIRAVLRRLDRVERHVGIAPEP